MDEKVRDRVNVLNNMKYKTVSLQKKNESLNTKYDQMVKDASDAVATDAGESEEAQVLLCHKLPVLSNLKFIGMYSLLKQMLVLLKFWTVGSFYEHS